MKLSSKHLTKEELAVEFDRQLDVLVSNDIHKLLKLSKPKFLEAIESLRTVAMYVKTTHALGTLPFAIVFKSERLDPSLVMEKVVAKNKTGFVEMNPKQPSDFIPIVELPEYPIYLITNIETGFNYLNISPAECTREILKRKRTPLTLEEGVMVALLFPEIFTDKKRFNAIQMSGSRIVDDERIPSIWFSKGAPRLGWCWDNNIHTWLGTASCSVRVGL